MALGNLTWECFSNLNAHSSHCSKRPFWFILYRSQPESGHLRYSRYWTFSRENMSCHSLSFLLPLLIRKNVNAGCRRLIGSKKLDAVVYSFWMIKSGLLWILIRILFRSPPSNIKVIHHQLHLTLHTIPLPSVSASVTFFSITDDEKQLWLNMGVKVFFHFSYINNWNVFNLSCTVYYLMWIHLAFNCQ